MKLGYRGLCGIGGRGVRARWSMVGVIGAQTHGVGGINERSVTWVDMCYARDAGSRLSSEAFRGLCDIGHGSNADSIGEQTRKTRMYWVGISPRAPIFSYQSSPIF